MIDSTVAVNTRFHNTLWVPAHFHSYFLMGVVLMILGTVYHLVQGASGIPESAAMTRAIVGLVGLGGYGFLILFYVAGALGVPRRYAVYPDEVAQGVGLAQLALGFIVLLLVGAILYIWETGRRCVKALAA